MFPKQCLHCRGSHGVGKGPSEHLSAGALAKLLKNKYNREGHSRLAYTKQQVALDLLKKTQWFWHILPPKPPGASWVPWVPPGCLLGALTAVIPQP